MNGNRGSAVYPIGVVRQLTGLTDRQLRYYDEKGLVCPQRSRGNQRLYSPRDVERLNYIKRLVERGMRVKEVHEALLQQEREDRDKELQGTERGGVMRKPCSLYPLQNRAELLKALGEMRPD